MMSGRRGERQHLTHPNFFCIFGQSHCFFLIRREEGGEPKFFICRLISYSNGPLLSLSSIKLFFTSSLLLYFEHTLVGWSGKPKK